MKESQTTNSQNFSSRVYTGLSVARYLLLAVLLLIGILIASLNSDLVTLNYFWGALSTPLYLLLLASFTIGSLAGLGFNLIMHIRLSRHNQRLEKRCQLAELELTHLRTVYPKANGLSQAN